MASDPSARLVWFLALGFVAVVIAAAITVVVPELHEPEPSSAGQNASSPDGDIDNVH